GRPARAGLCGGSKGQRGERGGSEKFHDSLRGGGIMGNNRAGIRPLAKEAPCSPVATTPMGCAKPGDAGRATWAVNRRRSCDVFFVRPRDRNASRREHRAAFVTLE